MFFILIIRFFAISDFSDSSVKASDWVIANTNQYGVYRVNYTEENWKKLIDQLKQNHSVGIASVMITEFYCRYYPYHDSCIRAFVLFLLWYMYHNTGIVPALIHALQWRYCSCHDTCITVCVLFLSLHMYESVGNVLFMIHVS